MLPPGSVTHWIEQLKAGNHQAAQHLWDRFFQRLVALARARLQGSPRRVADEEDVALSAFDSFCRGAEQGRFPQLNDRNDLWQLLVLITARKVIDQRAYEGRRKRGGRPASASSPAGATDSTVPTDVEQVIGPEPTPEFVAQVAEQYQRLLDLLGDEQLRRIAQAKMEGYTTEEIAAQHGCVARTIERKLRLIRTLWNKELGHE